MELILYEKPGCPLCDEARERLDEALGPRGWSLLRRNILERDEWFATYRYRVPVLVVNGIERLELSFSGEDIEAALSAVQREAS